MSKRTSLILLIAIALVYVASANDNKNIVKCERNPGDGPNQMCTMELNPVCAYHKGDGQGTTVGNPCGACHQELYDYYTLGACEQDAQEESDDNNSGCGNQPEEAEEEESSEEPTPIVCDPTGEDPNTIMCPAIYQPICGYFNNDTNRENGQTISNACMACYYQRYDYYLPGECPEEEPLPEPEPLPADNEPVRCNTTGTVFGAVDCTAIYDPICGYFDNDTNRENGKTSSNACNGCFYELWDYYIPGECPKAATEPEVHVCNRTGTVFGAVSCLAVYQPVCGYFNNDTERANGQTASNDCTGCFYSLFDYYVDGACKGDEQAI